MKISRLDKIRYPNWFLLPGFAIFFIMFIIPSVASLWYSLTDWNLNRPVISFIGLDNFKELFASQKLRATIGNTFIYSLSCTLLRNFIGLILAVMLNSRIRGRDLLRTIVFLPYVIAPIVIGYLFTSLMNPSHGMINMFFNKLGLQSLAKDWLNDPSMALFSTVIVDVWRTTGFSMVIYLAGLQIIPPELFESASIDGADSWWKFKNITLPLLAPSITINVVLAFIGTMKVFVMILVLTNGGPGYATEVMNTFIYSEFSLGRYGFGTAANVVLSILIMITGFPVLLLLRRREIEL